MLMGEILQKEILQNSVIKRFVGGSFDYKTYENQTRKRLTSQTKIIWRFPRTPATLSRTCGDVDFWPNVPMNITSITYKKMCSYSKYFPTVYSLDTVQY